MENIVNKGFVVALVCMLNPEIHKKKRNLVQTVQQLIAKVGKVRIKTKQKC